MVGSTTIPPNDPSVSYVTPPCNSYANGVGQILCNGDMITTATAAATTQSITVNAYGSTDYNIYPHMQLLVGGVVVGEWDVTGTAQNYTVNLQATGMKYYHPDHLSNRLVTDSSGNTVAQMGHFPFGESWHNASGEKLLFTTYERDSESGNDYAMARYHVSRLGRLSSPDPLGGGAVNPQSLNRYSHSVNDPANRTDPSGLIPGCIPVVKNSDQETQSDDRHGPGPYEWGDAIPEPQGDCANYTGSGGSGGGIFLDGVDISDVPGLLGSGEANANCPGGNCGIFNQSFTAQNGQPYSIVPGVNGLTWTDANGDEVDAGDCAEPADSCLPALPAQGSRRLSAAVKAPAVAAVAALPAVDRTLTKRPLRIAFRVFLTSS